MRSSSCAYGRSPGYERGCRNRGCVSVIRMRRRAWICAAALVAAIGAAGGGGAAAVGQQGRIAFVRYSFRVGHPQIHALTFRTMRLQLLRLPGPATQNPAWSRDGRELAFVAGKNTANSRDISGKVELYVLNASSGAVRRVTRYPLRIGAPAWSPEGKSLVVVRSAATGNGSSLWIVRVDSGRMHRLTYGSIDLEPSWAPDGRTIAFLRIDPKTYQGAVWEVRPDGSGLHRILPHLKDVTEPVWSPNGERLLVHDSRAIYSVRPDGSGRRTIAKLSHDRRGVVEDPQPSWSPDGRWVAFCQLRNTAVEASSIWIVRADGTGLRALTRSMSFDTDPSWTS
jgi:TolB protein